LLHLVAQLSIRGPLVAVPVRLLMHPELRKILLQILTLQEHLRPPPGVLMW
jgi:hypothetical protein